jgi:LPXTG-site transpeptidase (sortase) family protein
MLPSKILKFILGILTILVVGFVLLNFDYFSQQIRYSVNRTFVTEAQREIRRDEQNIALGPNELYIPTLDIRAPIILIDSVGEEVFQSALEKGVVLYPGTAPVGSVGNSYIFGHSSDYVLAKGDYKTVFALLPKIEIGAEILVTNERGEKFEYKVYDKFVAQKTATYLLDQDTKGKKILTLQTSYPIGTALQRYIVKAELKPE